LIKKPIDIFDMVSIVDNFAIVLKSLSSIFLNMVSESTNFFSRLINL